jgi:hypothetical protein
MNGEALKIHIPSTTYPQFAHNSLILSLLKRSKGAFCANFASLRREKRKESAQLGGRCAKNLRAEGGSGGFAGAGNKDDAKKVRHSCNNLPLEV